MTPATLSACLCLEGSTPLAMAQQDRGSHSGSGGVQRSASRVERPYLRFAGIGFAKSKAGEDSRRVPESSATPESPNAPFQRVVSKREATL